MNESPAAPYYGIEEWSAEFTPKVVELAKGLFIALWKFSLTNPGQRIKARDLVYRLSCKQASEIANAVHCLRVKGVKIASDSKGYWYSRDGHSEDMRHTIQHLLHREGGTRAARLGITNPLPDALAVKAVQNLQSKHRRSLSGCSPIP